ncbi:Aristolochene synthase in complex with 12,13-Difluorofarnesyl diphosphate [Annulohypoxylon maeteangense]|uniref:Aristolochene synthase in complex with 12,13-Difluorofarnesyl diphosphate n=1 Tax=Annulohypoxylon maeteangense TaxID=1927788 RepID=UPI0020089918|nr:Aristolochene synthase in complex with 12,13-Difluorofarnesyl diphosphate [Annulohypoxylon maeteangense]KAI0883022.1 Aristolochene synthase in complex with 12,13-Difluorofarnesyl diphosphate [Annulohypoxylon maeteangense]
MAPMVEDYVPVSVASITQEQAKPAASLTRRGIHVPSSDWTAQIHPLHEKVIAEVDGYFLQHWPFPNGKARRKFVAAGFSRVTCLYFPKALDDRIHYACRLLTLLFLVDDILEHMSLEDGRAYNERLMPLFRGTVLPDRSIPVEWIGYDLWESMREKDRDMADEIMEPVFTFMRAQTDPARLTEMGLGKYLEYREADVGKALLAALMRFSMALTVPASDQEMVRPVDRNCSKHLSVINDIWSYEKEVLAAQTLHEEGGMLCTAVAVLGKEAEISTDAAKRVLYHLCREWEIEHQILVAGILARKDTPVLRAYLQGLELQMSGNELWSKTTLRYVQPKD